MTPIPEVATLEESSSFIAYLRSLEHGRLVDELDDAHINLNRELAKAEERGSAPKGDLTVRLSFQLQDGMLRCVADVKVTKPRTKRPSSVAFINAKGEVVGQAPRQIDAFEEPKAAPAVSATPIAVPAVSIAPQSTVSVSVAPAPQTPVSVQPAAAAAPGPYSVQQAVIDAAAGEGERIPHSHLRIAQ